MAIECRNSFGRVYYIKKRLTQKGNVTYLMTTKLTADCVEEVPVGFEVWESPENSMLTLRKAVPSQFTDAESRAVKKALASNRSISRYTLDIRGKTMTVWVAENQSFLSMHQQAMMRFLIGEEEGEKHFEAQRFCFRGSIDDWIWIGDGSDLSALAEKYCAYLGKEDFFELPYLP